jgi:hypothetical protein
MALPIHPYRGFRETPYRFDRAGRHARSASVRTPCRDGSVYPIVRTIGLGLLTMALIGHLILLPRAKRSLGF